MATNSKPIGKEILEVAKDFYQIEENKADEGTVLKRLAETAKTARQTIAYKLQLAESFEETHERDAAKIVLIIENALFHRTV